MTWLSLFVALLIEQYKPLSYERVVAGPLARYAAWFEQRLNAGEARHGVVAWSLAVGLPVAAVWLRYARSYAILSLSSLPMMYSCVCADGYSGASCETVLDPCAPVECGAHGACEGGACVCADGYTGDHCETAPSAAGNLVFRMNASGEMFKT